MKRVDCFSITALQILAIFAVRPIHLYCACFNCSVHYSFIYCALLFCFPCFSQISFIYKYEFVPPSLIESCSLLLTNERCRELQQTQIFPMAKCTGEQQKSSYHSVSHRRACVCVHVCVCVCMLSSLMVSIIVFHLFLFLL